MSRPYPEAGELQLGLGDLFDVDVLERHDAHVLDEPRGPVHVPDPSVVQRQFEEDFAVRAAANVEAVVVREVEAALGLDHVREQPHHVSVLAVELQLHLGFVLLEILGAHATPSSAAAAKSAISSSCPITTVRVVSASAPPWAAAARRTLTKEKRCSSQGPCAMSAASCSGVQ